MEPLDLERLVVSQKAKLIELTNGYRIFDAEGTQGEDRRRTPRAMSAENLVPSDFQALDVDGKRVGNVNKKWAGLGTEMFTTADNYVLEVDGAVSGPFRQMVVASAATLDTALKQDAQGFN